MAKLEGVAHVFVGGHLRKGKIKHCWCGKEFVAYRSTARFCSMKCSARTPEGKLRRARTMRKAIKAHWSPGLYLKNVKKITVATLDHYARKLCHARGACEAKGAAGVECSKVLQWAHIISRSYKLIRWDADNCLCLCAAHHWFFTTHTLAWESFRDEKIGVQRYAELRARALAGGKPDKFAIMLRLRTEWVERGLDRPEKPE